MMYNKNENGLLGKLKLSGKSKSEIEKLKVLLLILIAASAGVLCMPHDSPVATMAGKYIFPGVVAGFCLGIAFMAAVEFWRLSQNGTTSSCQKACGTEKEVA